jgi:hypothetical protein
MPRVLFALCFLLVGEARGQDTDYDARNFHGLKSVRLLSERLDHDSEACGLNKEVVENAVQLPINAYNKLQVTHCAPRHRGG